MVRSEDEAYLYLVDVDLLVLFLHLLDAELHGVHCGLGVLELLGGKVGLLHVEGLAPESLQLLLVVPLLLQGAEGTLLDHVLWEGVKRRVERC